ncbi:Initiation factor eIF-4 gamma, MA3 [Kalmanozyma brasiliensis GHG001]|uniref:MI domain-containing protein n=1 Tax=Kalmanozyma brasiliensis (strain GHG001) TaxID=1365824 RepID=V5GU07_KALBG|nr:Initiation factor eIF-4 gamma, MA3 [Kalmanozyma brasiliensis GHG001]EST09392.1 Initiation factor eIF-4 gamma, MA3 [Kalmanozyma brasiliensis GHG001]
MSSDSSPAGNSNHVAAAGPNGDANAADNSRRQSAVSLPKGAAANARPGAAINFGSVHDQNAMLSSSPAAQPSSGQHLHGEKPTVFGSVAANDSNSKKTTIGFAGGKSDAPSAASGNGTPAKSMDFQKLFQGSGSPAPSPATASTASTSPSASSAAAPSTAPSTPQPHAPSQNQQGGARHASSNLRPPSGTPHHPGARPFEPQRSPSAHQAQGSRIASQGPPHQQFHGHPQGGPQQPRSPHMANAVPMQAMQAMGGPWQHQQPMGYAPPQYGYHPGYGYQPVPQHWQQQQQQQNQQQQQSGYDMPGTPRSPRHANMGSSPMGPNGLPGTPNMAPSTPLSGRGANVPPSPSTGHSNVSSPAHQPMSLAQGGRTPSFSPATSYAHHSPSHSFSNPMSPAARQFEPQVKRQSAAIRIVNPETQAAVDVQSIQRTPSVSQKSTPVPAPATPAAAPAVSSPSVSKAAPTVVHQPAKSTPVRMETQEAFLARLKADADKKKAERDSSAKDTDADKKQADDKDKADAEAKKKADEEAAAKAAAAAKKEAEDKAAAERKAAEEAEAKTKAEAEKKEREDKEKAEAESKAKADAEAQKKADEAKKAEDDAEAKAGAAAAATAAEAKPAAAEDSKPKKLAPIDTEKASQHQEGDGKDAAGMRSSVADVERMAREASSVPPSAQDAPRTPGLPQTPRTPGTPGFAGLPAKPLSTLGTPANGIKLDSEALEKKKKVTVEPTGAAASQHAPKAAESSSSGASSSLTSAKFIDNFSKVSYPDNINSPKSELNESAEPGKFRYDRDFLLQFMNVYTEKPVDLPPLASIGMESGGMGASSRLNRRSSAMGPPAAPGRAQGLGISSSSSFGGKGGIGSFSHPAKTSEERFAAASGARGGAMGAFGGPMGSFNAGARSQPLSRTGSGSTALPSRDMMGTGIPNGGRTKSNRGRQRDPNSSRGPQVNPPEKGGPTIPLDQVVPLANSENRWSRGATVKADSPELVQRKVKALLNKLTLEKFDSISNQILEWANKSVSEDDGRTLRQVIQLIFEKATDEAAWSEMYARLCRKLMEEVSQEVKDESLRTTDGKPVVGGSLFRKYLLNRCQEDFERGWAQRDTAIAAAKSKEAEDKAKKDSNDKAEADAKAAEERGEKPAEEPKEAELLSDEYYEAQKAKRRGLGLVRFIGELFKLSMLTERIMHLCIKKLLANATDPEEEEIESLCKLMTTVGKLLDTEKARGHMDVYFQRMKEMSKNEAAINSRMRFMLTDVIELRESRWVPRHDNSAPKTIAQIHADAAKQQAQRDAENAMRARGGPISRGGSKRGQARGDGPDGWSTVGGGPAPPPRPSKAGDLSHFGKIERGTSGRPLSFGPSTMLGRKAPGKGSEDGSQPPTRTSSQTNMFSLLNQAGEGDAAPSEEPQRPKLNLAPRTKPLPGADEDGEGKDEADAEGEGEGEDDSAKPADDMSDEEAKRKINNDIKEFLEIKDVNEGVEAFNTLPESRRSQFVDAIVGSAIEKKKDDVANVAALFAKLSEDGHLDEDTAFKGFEPHMEFLDDAAIDIPAIYSFVADLLVGAKLSQDKIEELAGKIEGEGLKTPKDKLLEKVAAAQE